MAHMHMQAAGWRMSTSTVQGCVLIDLHNYRRRRNFRGSLIFVGEHYPRKLDPRKLDPRKIELCQ